MATREQCRYRREGVRCTRARYHDSTNCAAHRSAGIAWKMRRRDTDVRCARCGELAAADLTFRKTTGPACDDCYRDENYPELASR